MIATDFLFPRYRVSHAMMQMKECGHFTDHKPASYWLALMRHLRRRALLEVAREQPVQEEVPLQVKPEEPLLMPLSESTIPLKSVISFLLLTLHLAKFKPRCPGDWALAF